MILSSIESIRATVAITEANGTRPARGVPGCVRYHLAVVLASQGNRAATRTELDRFLDIRKNADEDLTEVADTRRRLGLAPALVKTSGKFAQGTWSLRSAQILE
jgi:hypothetical protein